MALNPKPLDFSLSQISQKLNERDTGMPLGVINPLQVLVEVSSLHDLLT